MTTKDKLFIAHRGLWDEVRPENSMGAFKRCIEENIPIELDVHILKDSILVVFHDDNLLRMTGVNRYLKDCTYDEIKDLKLLETEYCIPTFKEVLDFVNGQVLLDIEVKCDVMSLKICKIMSEYLDQYRGAFQIKSFSPYHLAWFRFHRPQYKRGLLVSRLSNTSLPKFVKYLLFNMKFNFLCRPNFIAFDRRDLPNRKLDELHKSGIPIYLWTIRDENYENIYDGIIFEHIVVSNKNA